MSTYRKAAILAGILFIAGLVFDLLSEGVTGSLVNTPEYLRSLSSSGNQVLVGALFELIDALASAGIALALYPVLKRSHEGLALGAVGFRLMECVFYLVDILGLLLLLALSQAFVKAGMPADAYFQTLGTLIKAARMWANYVLAVSAFSLGAMMYYTVLYRARLVPRWLAGWGGVGAACALVAAVLMLFGLAPYSLPMIILILPIALQEQVLAIWLLVKGFNASAIASQAASPSTPAAKVTASS
jgi:hypothetical protein